MIGRGRIDELEKLILSVVLSSRAQKGADRKVGPFLCAMATVVGWTFRVIESS